MKKSSMNKGRNNEVTCSNSIGRVIGSMRKNWQLNNERTFEFEGKNKLRPDILIEEEGLLNVIIENEIEPANPDTDALKKLDLPFKNSTQCSECIIALQIPKRFKTIIQNKMDDEFMIANDINYAVFTKDYDKISSKELIKNDTKPHIRFPEKGWLVGSLRDVANAAQISAVSKKRVDDCVDIMDESIGTVSKIIAESSSGVKEEIAKLLFQKVDMQTYRMAGLILSNAFMFHGNIAGEKDIPTFQELSILGEYPVDELYKSWEKILEINYYAIFDIAKNILGKLSTDSASSIIKSLVASTTKIITLGMSRSTDMYGSLIQRMIDDRKTLASFYTLPQSAALLAGLVLPSIENDVWKKEEYVKKIKFADFACGTGTLLTTAYMQIGMNYEINGDAKGRMRDLHEYFLAKNITGFDVLPSAVHLTVSALGGLYPRKLFEKTMIGTTVLGKKDPNDAHPHLGSLDLIDEKKGSFEGVGSFIISDREEKFIHFDVSNDSIDYIMMNPPFTSNTREGGKEGYAMFSSFGTPKDVKKEMSRLEKKKFANTCADGNAGYATNFIAIADKKLRPGGTFGFIIPSTIHYGDSWKKVRELLLRHYDKVIVVSIASSYNRETSFSADTALNEVILIARKSPEKDIADVDSTLVEIRRNKADITKRQNMIKNTRKKKTKIINTPDVLKKEITGLELKIEKLDKKLEDYYKTKRGIFISIECLSDSVLESIELAKFIHKQTAVTMLESESKGTTNVMFGNTSIGSMLDCPLHDDYWFVGVQDPALFKFGYQLSRGNLMAIAALDSTPQDIPMTKLGNLGCMGPSSRDIGQEPNTPISKVRGDTVEKKPRAPFWILSLPKGRKATYLALWNNDNEKQNQLVVTPDRMASPKQNAEKEKIDRVLNSASNVHLNILTRFTSQSLLVLYTERKTFGSGSLPTITIRQKFAKALSVWGNSTFGILCYWLSAGKQQLGRGIHSRTTLQKLPILDFEKLTYAQIKKFNAIFDKYQNETLGRMKHLDRDKTRIAIDEEILKILDIDIQMDDIRKRLSLEPSINGGVVDLP